MATSPNYGWSEPDNTSLVKDGALAMRTLGDAIDTSLWNVGKGQAGKNKIINGDFGIWQRGTSFTPNTGGFLFTADRWLCYNYGGSGALTVSQQTFTPGTAPVTGYEAAYFMRITSTINGAYLAQKIEDVRTFANQTITVSFWAKSASNQTLSDVWIAQDFGSGGSALTEVYTTSKPSITTSWARYSVTFSVPSIAGKTIGTGSSFILNLKGNINNALDVALIMAEAGSIATPFQTATGTIAGELAACQRYYYRLTAPNAFGSFGVGGAYATNAATIQTPLPVTMRVAPTSVDYSTVRLTNTSAGWAVTSLILDPNTGSQFIGGTAMTIGTSSLTIGNVYLSQANASTSGYLGFSAEL